MAPSAAAERLLEAALWTLSLATLHLAFDVLVRHQYGREIDWPAVVVGALRAWGVFLLLFYTLHPFDPPRPRHQAAARQAVFFAAALLSGCALVHVTNAHGHLATMKQAPPLGCLWVWAVVELDLAWGAASLAAVALFLRVGGYDLR